jgi:hypothetical protein
MRRGQTSPSSAKLAWGPIRTSACSDSRTEPSAIFLAAHTPSFAGVQAQEPGLLSSLRLPSLSCCWVYPWYKTKVSKWLYRVIASCLTKGDLCRYKSTIICQEVAKAKNVCQVCLLDLEYGIPVQARDTALGIEDESLPESDVGKEFRLKEMENAGLLESSFSKVCSILSLIETVHSLSIAPTWCCFN